MTTQPDPKSGVVLVGSLAGHVAHLAFAYDSVTVTEGRNQQRTIDHPVLHCPGNAGKVKIYQGTAKVLSCTVLAERDAGRYERPGFVVMPDAITAGPFIAVLAAISALFGFKEFRELREERRLARERMCTIAGGQGIAIKH
ncbi:hypothetical protein [Streptomyces sp. NBC_00989]|uniref:hypothetical protein n=1 Tax=Streptomyces sp. NBC_00989 TaxID=2903705 RepID=UPI00386F7DDD|nr:hypothetical protein OG714_44385 [Streptomyces sp. NBC_00989]